MIKIHLIRCVSSTEDTEFYQCSNCARVIIYFSPKEQIIIAESGEDAIHYYSGGALNGSVSVPLPRKKNITYVPFYLESRGSIWENEQNQLKL